MSRNYRLSLTGLLVATTFTVGGGGCGGGTRGTGVGGLLSPYESSFIGDGAEPPRTTIFDRNDDGSDRSRVEPCPLVSSQDKAQCDARLKLLEPCFQTMNDGKSIHESESCDEADAISAVVRSAIGSTEEAALSSACKVVRNLCAHSASGK